MMGTPRRIRPTDVPIVLGLAFLLVSCSSAPSNRSSPVPKRRHTSTTTAPRTRTVPPATAERSPLRLSYEDPAPDFVNGGRARLQIAVVSADGGTVGATEGRTASEGQAVRFPPTDPTAPAPRAVIQVTNVDASDRLSPGDRRFEYGTDFTLDAASADLDPASIDDGDNLVQRGRYDDVTQYKLEIDHRQPICRVKGRGGEVTVVAGIQVEPDRWYRARCIRDRSKVTVSVSSWNADGSLATRTFSKAGATGDMTTDAASVPLSVGGKLGGSGIAGDADQFNGRLDNTYVSFG